ncbi:3-1, partial [Durusdinium trenchii]
VKGDFYDGEDVIDDFGAAPGGNGQRNRRNKERGAWAYGGDDQEDEGDEDDEADINLLIHIVPHSHVDAGWTDTMDATFEASVGTILHKVLEQLDNDLKRRFVWSEVLLFKRWYEGLPQSERQRVKRAVNEGQLEFVGGGLVEHDEALSTMHGAMEQLSVGHEWLEKHLGVRPRVAWQIDSAGHSDVTPGLLSAMGFDALIINRVHYRVKQQFKAQKHLEFVWRGSDLSGGRDKHGSAETWQPGDLFTHVLYQGFSAPEGYDFESGKGVRQVTNAKRRAERLVHDLREWSGAYRTHHLLVPFGDVLRFAEADKQFTNMEKLMRFINDKIPDVQIRFSTASDYLKAVRETAAVTGLEFPRYEGDFYAYADKKDAYWSGLFSSRMAFKELCRDLEASLREAEVLFALARTRATAIGDAPRVKSISNGVVEADHAAQLPAWDTDLFDLLEQARLTSGLMTHHHAITGSSRATVINDYVQQIQAAQGSLQVVAEAALAHLTTKRAGAFKAAGPRVRPTLSTLAFNLAEELELAAEDPQLATLQHPIVVFNGEAVPQLKVVHIFVGSDWNALRHVQIVDSNGDGVPAQLYHHVLGSAKRGGGGGGGGGGNKKKKGKQKQQSAGSDQLFSSKAELTSTKVFLTFVARVPALGFTTYFCHTTTARDRVRQSQLANAATPVTRLLRLSGGKLVGGKRGGKDKGAGKKKNKNKNKEDQQHMRGKVIIDEDDFGDSFGNYDDEDDDSNDAILQDDNSDAGYEDDEDGVGNLDPLEQQVQHQQGVGRRAAHGEDSSGAGSGSGSGEVINGIELVDTIAKGEKMITLENDRIQVQVQLATGMLHSILDKTTKRNTLLNQEYLSYPGPKSGVHVFRPEKSRKVDFRSSVIIAVSKGPLFEQVQVIGNNGIGHCVRVWRHGEPGESGQEASLESLAGMQGFVEVNHIVAPEVNRDVAVRFATSMDTDGVFYTDNPRGDLVKRATHREAPFASSVFPATSTVALRDNQATAVTRMGQVLAVVSKAPFAASSPFVDSGTGTLEMILHRNYEADDGRGLNEGLKDFSISTVSTVLAVGTPTDMLLRLPHLRRRLQRPTRPFYALETTELAPLLSRENWASRFNTELSLVARDTAIPTQLELDTFRVRDASSDEILLRLRHLGGSGPMSFSVGGLLDASHALLSVEECGLDFGAVEGGPASVHVRDGNIELFVFDFNQADEAREKKAKLEEIATDLRANIEAMQRRVEMYKSNIDQLLTETTKFERQGNKRLKDATVEDLTRAENSLQQATTSLESSKQELLDVLGQIKALDSSFKMDEVFIFESDVLIRDAEKEMHGMLKGAAAMLLIVLAGNRICSTGGVRAYVPISIRFSQSPGAQELPLHESKVN